MLTQHDIRELQKAKGAIRAAIDTLMAQLDLAPGDLTRLILTGSFGSQLSIDAVVGLGMTPPVAPEIIEMSPNGAGFGAAMMLDAEEFARAERIAAAAEQVDLDLDPEFDRRYVRSLRLDEGRVLKDVAENRLLRVAPVVVATLCWSTAGIFISWTLQGSNLASLGLAFWRVLAACLCLAAILFFAPGGRELFHVPRRELPWLAALGVLAVGVFQVLWILGIITNGASLATVIQCNAPIIVTVLARIIWREPLTWRKWAAIGLAFLGTALVAQLGGSGNLQLTPRGLLISLGAAFTYALITLFTKKLTTDGVNQWTILVYSFGFAALALLPFQFSQPPVEVTAWTSVAAFAGLVLITTIAGYGAYAGALRHLQASVASILALTEVPFAAGFAYVFLGERMNGLQILGALAIVGGVVLLAAGRTPNEAPAANPPQASLVIAKEDQE